MDCQATLYFDRIAACSSWIFWREDVLERFCQVIRAGGGKGTFQAVGVGKGDVLRALDFCVQLAFAAVRHSHGNRVLGFVEGVAGPVFVNFPDGVGMFAQILLRVADGAEAEAAVCLLARGQGL